MNLDEALAEIDRLRAELAECKSREATTASLMDRCKDAAKQFTEEYEQAENNDEAGRYACPIGATLCSIVDEIHRLVTTGIVNAGAEKMRRDHKAMELLRQTQWNVCYDHWNDRGWEVTDEHDCVASWRQFDPAEAILDAAKKDGVK